MAAYPCLGGRFFDQEATMARKARKARKAKR